MKNIRKSVSIDAPPEQVYDYVTRPNNLLDIWPSLIEAQNVSRQDDGSHSFDWTYKMAGVRFHGHSVTTDVEENRRVVIKNEGGIDSTFHWQYEPQDGGTLVTVEIEYQIPNKVLDKLAEPIIHRLNEREAETLLHNLKEMLELGGARAAE